MEFYIKTSEITAIAKWIGVEGRYVNFPLDGGLSFERRADGCYLFIPGILRMKVNKMNVSKTNVIFENTDCPDFYLNLSRSKKPLS